MAHRLQLRPAIEIDGKIRRVCPRFLNPLDEIRPGLSSQKGTRTVPEKIQKADIGKEADRADYDSGITIIDQDEETR